MEEFIFLHTWILKNYQILNDQENSIEAFKKGFQLPKVKCPQKKEKEMKMTECGIAFHAEGKNDDPCEELFKNTQSSSIYVLSSLSKA